MEDSIILNHIGRALLLVLTQGRRRLRLRRRLVFLRLLRLTGRSVEPFVGPVYEFLRAEFRILRGKLLLQIAIPEGVVRAGACYL